MNKKGFAISVVLYSIVFLLISILYMILGLLKTRYHVGNDLRDGIVEQLDDGVRYLTATEHLYRVSYLEDFGGGSMFVGSNPYNYVSFNNETWRIIGVFGNKIKIIRSSPSSLSTVYSSSGSTNDWGSSNALNYLTETYYPSLTADAKKMISEDSDWYIGKVRSDMTSIQAYTASISNTLAGKIGLINTQEYLFAAGNECNNTLGSSGFEIHCKDVDWLYNIITNNKTKDAWTISASSDNQANVIKVSSSTGNTLDADKGSSLAVTPVVYLKENVKITGGTGEVDNEFILKIDE